MICSMPGASEQPSGGVHCLARGQAHTCDRFCVFEHICGNVWSCQRSGKTHVCDSTCTETVSVDSYTSICRLSKRVVNKRSSHSEASR